MNKIRLIEINKIAYLTWGGDLVYCKSEQSAAVCNGMCQTQSHAPHRGVNAQAQTQAWTCDSDDARLRTIA